jgi:hypothetical protein
LKLRFCAEAPGKIQPLTMLPLAMAGGAGSRIAAAPATGSAGEECGERCELTYDRFASFNGVEGLPTGRAAAPGGDRSGNGAPGDGVGSAGQPATLEAVVEGRGVEGVHKRSFGGVEGKLALGGHGGHGTLAQTHRPFYRHEQ